MSPGPGSSSPPAVKICGLTRIEDARVTVEAGAAYLGAILSPGFTRSVSPERAAAFLPRDAGGGAGAAAGEVVAGSGAVGPSERRDGHGQAAGGGAGSRAGPTLVAVLVDPTVAEAAAAARAAGAGVLQLHGDEPPSLLRALRDEGGWTLWKALQVLSAEDVLRALECWAEVADGLLLEGGRGGRGGGVGARFPWAAVEPFRDAFPSGLAFIAAGGLEPSNVEEAVRRLSPDVVDVSSGVEVRTGEKDPARIRAFLRNARTGRGVL